MAVRTGFPDDRMLNVGTVFFRGDMMVSRMGKADGHAPHLAYVLLWYPLFTQPFLFREVEGLKALGMPLTVYSLFGQCLRECTPEMLAVAGQTRTHGARMLPAFLKEFVVQLARRPRTLLGLLRRCLFRRWPSWEVLGENVWGFLAGVYLARCLQKDGIDMIHAPWPRGTATAALVASILSGIPFSTSARGDNLNPADPDLVDKLVAAHCIRANNLADIERMRQMLPASCAAKIHLVYNSLTLKVSGQCPVSMHSPLRLLAVGRFDITKGFEYLLEACHILKAQGFAFHLTLAGGGGRILGLGNMGPQLDKLRRQWQLESLVTMPGLVTHDTLPELFLSHDIFVAPCVIHASGRRDGIPNTIIEAMAYGMPVVSTRIHAIPEVVHDGETGLLVPQKNAAALAASLRVLADNPEKARRLGENGRLHVARMFDPQTNTCALGHLFITQYAIWKEQPPCAA